MRVLLIKATGKLGKRVLKELENHDVEVIKFIGDATKIDDIEKQCALVDTIILVASFKNVSDFTKAAENLIKVAKFKKMRLIWSGGAASLYDKNGARAIDLPEDQLPKEWLPSMLGHANVLEKFKSEGESFRWTFMSPPLIFEDVDKKGTLLALASEKALYNNKGESFASYQIGAEAIVAELLNPEFTQKRFTIIEEL